MMVLRSKPLVVLAVSCFLHLPVNEVHGQAKRKVADKTAQSSADKPKPQPVVTPPPKPPPPKEIFVCLRPPGVAAHEYKWGYDAWGQLITKNLDTAVGPGGTPLVFVFDSAAQWDSVRSLRAPHNTLRCPSDSRPATASTTTSETSAPKPVGFLASLPTASTAKEQPLPDRVVRYCKLVDSFGGTTNPHAEKAQKFAKRLRNAITKGKPMNQITTNELSVEAAKILTDYFQDTITAAVAYREVVAPLNVQRQFMKAMGEPLWKSFPIIHQGLAKLAGIGTAETVPAVILKGVVYDQMSSAVAQLTPDAMTLAEVKEAYTKAYGNHRRWLKAIAPYFKEKVEEEAEDVEETP